MHQSAFLRGKCQFEARQNLCNGFQSKSWIFTFSSEGDTVSPPCPPFTSIPNIKAAQSRGLSLLSSEWSVSKTHHITQTATMWHESNVQHWVQRTNADLSLVLNLNMSRRSSPVILMLFTFSHCFGIIPEARI